MLSYMMHQLNHIQNVVLLIMVGMAMRSALLKELVSGMEGRFRFLSCGSTRSDVSHESNALGSGFRCRSAYHENAV